jgi:hypothetical protein
MGLSRALRCAGCTRLGFRERLRTGRRPRRGCYYPSMPNIQKRTATARSLARGLPQGTFDFGELVEFISWEKAVVAQPAPAEPLVEVPVVRHAPELAAEDSSRETKPSRPVESQPAPKARCTKPKRVRISFEAPARMNAKLEKVAREQDRTKTTILREAVARYLKAPSTEGGVE